MFKPTRQQSALIDRAFNLFDEVREPGRVYSQTEIAAATGVSKQLIGQIEKRALAKLARAARQRQSLDVVLPATLSR